MIEDSRAAQSREAVRIRRGVYHNGDWAQLSREQRYLLRLRAYAQSRSAPAVFSHQSAALIWGLPFIGGPPQSIQVTAPLASGGRSARDITVFGVNLQSDEMVTKDGFLLTSLSRTLLDLATTASFMSAIVALDYAVADSRRLITVEQLLAALEVSGIRRNVKRVRRAISFATTLSGSVGESASRVTMQTINVPPRLQVPFTTRDGKVFISDFYWDEFDAIGEFDGRAKYEREEFLENLSPKEKLWSEKRRKDALRPLVSALTRWTWDVAVDPRALAARLAAAGVVPTP